MKTCSDRISAPAALALLLVVLASPDRVAARDVLVSQEATAFSKNSPDVAVDPTDSSHVVAVYEQETVKCAFSITRDAGASFSSNSLSRPVGTVSSSSPSVTFDSHGNAFIACIHHGGDNPLYSITVSRIPHGTDAPEALKGVTASITPVLTTDPLISADPGSTSPFKDSIYVTWVQSLAPPLAPTSSINVSYSRDGGATFSDPVTIATVEPPDGIGRTSLAVGPDGTVYVSYLAASSAGPKVMLRSSTDGGITWGPERLVTSLNSLPNPLPGLRFATARRPFVTSALGQLIAIYSDCLAGRCDVFTRRSTDAGATWETPVRVTDDAPGLVRQHFLPRITADPASGTLFAAWLDNRHGIGNLLNVWTSTSSDHGRTWSKNVRVNDVAIDPEFVGLGSTAGDQLGMAVVPGDTEPHVAWVRGGTLAHGEIFASFPRAPKVNGAVLAAVLPSARSPQVSNAATAFLTVINAGTTTARSVRIELGTSIPASFSFQAVDPANHPTGAPDALVDIPPGESRGFMFALTPTAPISPVDVVINVAGSNTQPLRTLVGVNTLHFSSSATPVIDSVMLAATPTRDGTLVIPWAGTGTGAAALSVASVNVGTSGSVTVVADVGGSTLPLSVSVCQTDSITSACLDTPGSSVTIRMDANTTATFGVFAVATGPILFDPANNRIVVRALDASGVQRGATSIAVRTE